MNKLLIVFTCFVLSACATQQIVESTGAEVSAPQGYIDMCARNPKLIECGGNE